MAMKPHKRAVAVTGTYTDRQGNEKKRYANIGTLFQYDDGGLTLKLDSIPVGDGWNGFVSFYDIEERGSAGFTSQQPAKQAGADMDDEIPF